MMLNNMRWGRLLGVGLICVVLLWAWTLVLAAAPDADTVAVDRYVRTGGIDAGDCSVVASPCRTIQYAHDVADPGDHVLVTGGIYTGAQTIYSRTQVVYMSKTLTLLGGYNAAFDVRDPALHPSILDAQTCARVVYIEGSGTVTIDGFTMVNGDSGCGGGTPWGANLFAIGGSGPGLTVTLLHNIIAQGKATGSDGRGGGVSVLFTNLVMEDNLLLSNQAAVAGGALRAEQSNLRLKDNVVQYNSADAGGGLFFSSFVNATLTNTVLADNQATSIGTDLVASGSYVRAYHTTVARGSGGATSAFYVGTGFFSGNSMISLINSIFVSHTRAITVTLGNPHLTSNTVVLDGVLWFDNGENYGGAGTVTVTHAYTGSPAFASDGYHLGIGSAAVGRGVATTVNEDIDGELRIGLPDLGADELVLRVYVPTALRES